MGRNWTKIVQLPGWRENEMMRRVFAYAQFPILGAEELINSLERIHPNCFVEGDDIGRVPWSVLELVSADYFHVLQGKAVRRELHQEALGLYGLDDDRFLNYVARSVESQQKYDYDHLLPEDLRGAHLAYRDLIDVHGVRHVIYRVYEEHDALYVIRLGEVNLDA